MTRTNKKGLEITVGDSTFSHRQLQKCMNKIVLEWDVDISINASPTSNWHGDEFVIWGCTIDDDQGRSFESKDCLSLFAALYHAVKNLKEGREASEA
jgi:hypothetical protein